MPWSLIFLIGTALWPAPRPAPAQTPPTDVVIKLYQSRAARDPDDVFPYAKLGAADFQEARRSAQRAVASGSASAMVRMHADGSVTLLTGTVECGQGGRTALSQIVAGELALPPGRIRVGQSELGMSPYDQATSASRSTTLMGLAVLAAARDVRDQLLAIGAGVLGAEPGALGLRDGRIVEPFAHRLPRAGDGRRAG